MSDEFYQCCYTNAEIDRGGTISSGWQTVVVSEDLPSSALDACVSWQNSNSAIKGVMRDEHGAALDLYEVFANRTYVYTMHSKYGTLDRLGRANMFSHAIVFDWEKSGALADPNVFLTLGDANYKDNAEEASALSAPLVRTAPLELVSALRELGMSRAAYCLLVRCVYAKLTEQSLTEPLFVAYDGTKRQMLLILYCLYLGLPYFLRRKLSVASSVANNAERTNIIFSMHASERAAFVNPKTGENNVLTPRLESKLSRWEFVDYAAAHLDDAAARAYFARLDRLAIELGDAASENPAVLRAAHANIAQPRLGELPDSELERRIGDVLTSRAPGTVRMDTYIADLLEEVLRRSLMLSPDNDALIVARLSSTPSEKFMAAAADYLMRSFEEYEAGAIASMLAGQGDQARELLMPRLAKTGAGCEALDIYYADFVLGESQPSWELLERVFDESARSPKRIRTLQRIDGLANELYRRALGSPATIAPHYQHYVGLMRRMLTDADAEGRERAARAAYWANMRFEDFDARAVDDHRMMADGSARMQMFASFAHLPYVWRERRSSLAFFEAVWQFFGTYGQELARRGEWVAALDSLCATVRGIYVAQDALVDGWVRAVVDAPSHDVVVDVSIIRNMLYCNRFDECVDAYVGMREKCLMYPSDSARGAVCQVAAIVVGCVASKEAASPDCVAPIDVWLVCGRDLYANPFEVFDHYPAAVLNLGAEEALAYGSKLLNDADIQLAGMRYAEAGGAAAWHVRSWLVSIGCPVGGDASSRTSGLLAGGRWPFVKG